MLPVGCPHHCVSSNGNDEMKDALEECDHYDESQMWWCRSDGSYIQIESYDSPGYCIAVDYDEKEDGKVRFAQACNNGYLYLKDCDDWGTEWYFTGGQLVNSMCWAAGLSSMMTVWLEDNEPRPEPRAIFDDGKIEECKPALSVYGPNADGSEGGMPLPLFKVDTFMFVNWLPDAPYEYDSADEVMDAIKGKIKDKFDLKANNKVANVVEGEGET